MKDATPPVQVGDVVDGKYRVERVVGSGGMGVVVAAEHLKLGKVVALKFLLKHACENHEAVTRFLREGQALASITSAHVARVMDVGTLPEGEPYIVMELLEGADLGAVLKHEGRLPIVEATRYVLQACEAVAEAHAKGIVHRDLKPSNLFLTHGADGVPLVKVLDFGISKAVVQQPRLQLSGDSDAVTAPPQHVTNTGALVGSPMYMSPEQIRNARRVDERTDIWSLGVILYELVCGVPPFEGETLSGTLAAVSADPPRTMRSLRDDVPPAFELVILRCLEKSPERRYASIAAFVRALEPFAPLDARPSVERISRLLGAHAAKPVDIVVGSSADEAAPTVPSWEGKASPSSTGAAHTRRRGLVALALGGVAAVLLWRLTRPPVERATSPTAAVLLDAAPVALPTVSAAPPSPPLATATANPLPSASSVEAAASAAALAAPATSVPPTAASARSAPRDSSDKSASATKPRTATKPRPASPPSHPDEDGTSDRK